MSTDGRSFTTADYVPLGARDRRWKPAARPVIVGLLALEASMAAAFAVWPPDGGNRSRDAVFAAVLALGSLSCIAVWRGRGPLILVEACLLMTWTMPIVFVVTRGLESSQLLWGAVLLVVSVATAFYLPRRKAVLQVGMLVIVYALAALVFEPKTRPMFVAGIIVCIVACTTAVALLREDRDRALQALQVISTTDPLTGLLNRRGLESEALVLRANAARAGQRTIVVLMDVDGLKHTNDTLGHRAGDGLIQNVAARWRATVREGDLLARVGGDEFALVLPTVDDGTAAAEMLRRVRDGASAPWSYGWTVWDLHEPLDDAINRADASMYADKRERNIVRGIGS